MSDSHTPEHRDEPPVRDPEQRIQAIERWVEYIRSQPPETWGPQQNAIVNGQLDAAQSVDTTATHRQRVSEVATEIIEDGDGADSDSED